MGQGKEAQRPQSRLTAKRVQKALLKPSSQLPMHNYEDSRAITPYPTQVLLAGLL